MRKEKQLLLNEIQEKIEGSTAMLVASYDKLEPNLSWQLRDLLAKSKSSLEVVRKRVFVKAALKAGIELNTELSGNIAVVFVGDADPMASAKAVFKFSSENADILRVLCGRLEGKIVPGAEVKALSDLPSLDEMRAILLGLLTSPMSHMLSVMEAAMAGPLSVIEQKSES